MLNIDVEFGTALQYKPSPECAIVFVPSPTATYLNPLQVIPFPDVEKIFVDNDTSRHSFAFLDELFLLLLGPWASKGSRLGDGWRPEPGTPLSGRS